jgi:hypothetical protein
MSDRQKKNTNLVVLHATPNHQALVKANRWLLATVFFLMSVIVLAGFLLFPRDDLTAYKKTGSTQDYADQMNPVLSAEVNALKGQFVGLLSGSIENKLKTLEDSVRLGYAPDSLMTIEELRNDIKTLRAYSDTPNNSKVTPPNAQLMEEMSELKKLVYLSLASCGLMFVAFAGIWISKRHRLPYKEIITRYLHRD